MFSALSLAKKARKEFERAVQLDEKNFSAYQALIEFARIHWRRAWRSRKRLVHRRPHGGALQSYSIKAWYAEKFFSSSWTARSNSLRAFLASDRAENMEA